MGLAAILAVPAFLLAATPALAQSPAQRLHALSEDMLERELDLVPLFEVFLQGAGPRAARAIVDLSPGADEKRRAIYRDVLDGLARIDAAALGESDRINHDILRLRARNMLAELDHPLREIRLLTPTRNTHASMIMLAGTQQPLRNAADFEAWFSRVDATSAVFDDAIRRLRSAAEKGWTTPRVLVERSLAQIERIVSAPADKGPMWGAMRRPPASIDAEARAAFEQRYRELLDKRYLPALRRFATFVREEYLPRARTTAGLGAMPGGDAAYRAQLREYTTLDLGPDEIHALGVSEVARIQPRLLEVARKLGFKGELKEFDAWLQGNPEGYPFRTADEVLERLRAIHRRVEPELPKLFKRLPRAAFEIRLVDPAIAASASANYMRPLPDGTRPGIFQMPVPDPRRVAAHPLTTLLMHEGMPGHHLDIGRMIELDLPRFRRASSITAYTEGWGLYAESLGHELGVYDDPWALLGRYAYELHRAVRLVVDTGIHARGWTREQAIRYAVEQGGEAAPSATVYIERYMSQPGQAVAYKIGELEILGLRDEARKALGDRFDLREFHEVVLAEGHVPLSVLRQRVRAWIAR